MFMALGFMLNGNLKNVNKAVNTSKEKSIKYQDSRCSL